MGSNSVMIYSESAAVDLQDRGGEGGSVIKTVIAGILGL